MAWLGNGQSKNIDSTCPDLCASPLAAWELISRDPAFVVRAATPANGGFVAFFRIRRSEDDRRVSNR